MTGFQFTEHNGKTRIFTITAKKFYLRNKKIKPFGFRVALGKSAELEGVQTFFYKENKPVSYIYSEIAIMDTNKKDIAFEGRPALSTEDGRALSAKKFTWTNFDKRLCAEGNCVLNADGKRYLADAIDTDIELKDFNIIEKEKGIRINKEIKG